MECLESLLVGLTFFTSLSFDLAACQEADSAVVQVESFLDSPENPIIGSSLLDHCEHKVLWAICPQADQKVLKSSPDLVCFILIRDFYGSSCFCVYACLHDVDAPGLVLIETGPRWSGACWKECLPFLELTAEGPVVHVPRKEGISGN